MKTILKAAAMQQFDKQLFRSSPYFITCNLFWDGGISEDCALSEKASFYSLADKMASIIKFIISNLDEAPLVGKSLCENGTMFPHWSDMDDNSLYRRVVDRFKKNNYYELSLPDDNAAIDLIVEANFMYLSHIALFLPKTKMLLVPTCHCEILVFAEDIQPHTDTLYQAVQKFSNIAFPIYVKYDGTTI